jgi:hypothetical protein
MKISHWIGILLLSMTLILAGCKEGQPAKSGSAGGTATGEEAKIKAELAKLGPEDQRLAEAQRWCPVSEEPLGSMEGPIKVSLGKQTVFLCCKSCEKRALANPEQTLAKVKELKEKAQAPK